MLDGKSAPDTIVTITNRGDAPAYWVRLLPAGPFPGGFLASADLYRSRLDPGEPFDIPVQVSHVHRPDLDPDAPPDQNPHSREATLSLSLVSAHTRDAPIRVDIPVRVLAPELHVTDLKVLKDTAGKPLAVEITVANKGQQDPEGVRVSIEFFDPASGDVLGRTEPQPLRRLSEDLWLPPGQTADPLSFTLPPAVAERTGDVHARVIMKGDIWPTHVWTVVRSLRPDPPGRPWLLYLGLALLGAFVLAGGVAYQLVFRNAIVTRYATDPDELRQIPAADAPGVHRQLARARKLGPLLTSLDIPPARWDRVLSAADAPVPALAAALRAELGDAAPLAEPVTLYSVTLPELPIPIETSTAIVEVRAESAGTADSGHAPGDLADILKRAIDARGLQGRYALVVDRTAQQDAAERVRDTVARVTVIDQRDVTRILLAARPVEALCQVIARTARLGDISPYQTSGGLERPGQFFGRENEFALLAGRETRNHLVIGARQMGKSSLLKRLMQRAPERVHMFTMTGGDLAADLERAGLPGIPDLATLDALPPVENNAPILLIDEADLFIRADRANGYALCRRLRAISEEGRCRFVLAGFWELHRAAYLEHQSPVRNFADPLPLGPLDEQAARALATRPLAALGLRWASDDLVTELLARTGRRPNLIALACDAAIRALPPLAERVLGAEELRAVLDVGDDSGAAVARFFHDLAALIDDRRARAIDRMVLYATVDAESFTQTDVRGRLQTAGAGVPVDALQESLERLTLAYAIQRRSGAFIYPVPLVRDYLLAESDGDPAAMLAEEIQQWRDESEA